MNNRLNPLEAKKPERAYVYTGYSGANHKMRLPGKPLDRAGWYG